MRRAEDVSTLLAAYAAVYPGTIVQQQPDGRGRPGQVVYAPVRGSRTVDSKPPSPANGFSERSENQGTDEGPTPRAEPQVNGLSGFSERMLGKSVLGNSLLGKSATRRDTAPACAVCAEPLDPALAAAGHTTHATCDPGEGAGQTERESASRTGG